MGGIGISFVSGCNALLSTACAAAGRFGFQKDMGAIASLGRPESEANYNVRALLESTEEVVARTKTFMRWWQLHRADVRAGWTTLGRFKVRLSLDMSL